jgi:predicted lipoprotein with Yx(FWY)xxD motif
MVKKQDAKTTMASSLGRVSTQKKTSLTARHRVSVYGFSDDGKAGDR